MKLNSKIAEWLSRYLPAEVFSTAVTLLAAWLVHKTGGSPVTLALVSTWSGNLTYFGYIYAADVWRSYHHDKTLALGVNLRNLVVEFGLAEALDSLLIRPLAMYYIPPIFHDFNIGIIAGKLSADILFYIPAILGYEFRKKMMKP